MKTIKSMKCLWAHQQNSLTQHNGKHHAVKVMELNRHNFSQQFQSISCVSDTPRLSAFGQSCLQILYLRSSSNSWYEILSTSKSLVWFNESFLLFSFSIRASLESWKLFCSLFELMIWWRWTVPQYLAKCLVLWITKIWKRTNPTTSTPAKDK